MTESKSWDHLYVGNEKRFEEPLVLEAEVTAGFKRGSTELGFPTANLSMETLGEKGSNLGTGIYYGMAHLNDKEHQTVISVGWNPFYKNEKKTIEAHILHKFKDDFYGSNIKLVLYGYLRPEADFESLDDLIGCIQSDINVSSKRLNEMQKYATE
mmetsp:Transcript_27740/g.26547  ORF Transcript_27740/g.26547 Transcript_27740/m.26547 type:complete len:155 (-) Transcript_27740:703-1167(-)|eukprot:CAMPEP_0119038416 /NCGR_PEP_ID=MMETSP1177-20130426/7360_1 /TAXON_ID=2985 /ORGANISM="Ochromonas sp, Strain CCMP1899" /LENGTH=154 /DNA_ID=CAMNT_0007001001 /DNA_START=118 /DNA_END=582 /DNA_ORIENTATION=-